MNKSQATTSSLVRESEIPYAGEVPLVPSVRPVLVLQGSDFDMGFQYARQLIQIFGPYYLEGASKVKRSKNDLSGVRKSEGYIKRYTPWVIEFVKGMSESCVAAGIAMSYVQMLAYFTSTKDGPSDPIEEVADADKTDCSGWAAWGSATKDGKLICGGSGDHEIRVGSKYRCRFETNVLFFPDNGNNYVFSPPTGGAGHPGMNNRGVCNVHHGATGYYSRHVTPELADSGEGVPRTFLLMHALRFSNSAEEAMDISLSIPNPGGWQGGFWADVNGNALVIENRDDPKIIRRSGDHGERDFLYATNNLFSDELKGCYKSLPGRGVVFFPHAGYLGTELRSLSSIGRNFEMWNLFHNYHGEVDLDFGKMMWRFAGPSLPYSTIEEAVADFEPSQAKFWNAHICQTGNAMVGVLQPDDGDGGLFHVSHGCAARGVDSPTYPGGIVARLKPTYTFFELKLAANPSEVSKAAQTRARYDLWNAYQELSKIDYSDVRYAPLDRLFNQAVVEWQKGLFYTDEAGETKGKEGVGRWARAIRCSTRCQCYARQVYNALIPPPQCPEDMGLRQCGWAHRGDR